MQKIGKWKHSLWQSGPEEFMNSKPYIILAVHVTLPHTTIFSLGVYCPRSAPSCFNNNVQIDNNWHTKQTFCNQTSEFVLDMIHMLMKIYFSLGMCEWVRKGYFLIHSQFIAQVNVHCWYKVKMCDNLVIH